MTCSQLLETIREAGHSKGQSIESLMQKQSAHAQSHAYTQLHRKNPRIRERQAFALQQLRPLSFAVEIAVAPRANQD